METVLSYLWVPVLIPLLAVALGLLVERIVRLQVPPALLAPVGLAAAMTLTLAVFRLELDDGPAAAVLAVGAVAGLALGRAGLRERLRPGWAGAAFLAGYALFVLPSALTGHWTWSGYNFVNDPATNFTYVDLLATQGIGLPEGPSSTHSMNQASVVPVAYPLGAHALLAAIGPLSLVGLPALYQPFIAVVAGLAAAALTVLLRRGRLPGPAAAGLAVLAVGGNLVYQYGQHGGIKEIVMVLLLAAAAAAAADGIARGLPIGAAAVVGLLLASTLAVLSAAGAPYVLATALVVGLALVLQGVRPSRGRLAALVGVGIAAALIAALPYLGDVVSFGSGAGQSFTNDQSQGSTTELGHLARDLPLAQGAGIWFGEDYRFALPPERSRVNLLQYALIVLLGVVALAGAVLELRRRRPIVLLLLVPAAVVLAAFSPRLSPYADAKLLLLLTPPLVASAGVALWALRGTGRAGTVVAAGIAALLGGSILYSDALASHGSRFAPVERLEAMEDAADHAGRIGRGDGRLWLINEWEEFGKYFARGIRENMAAESGSPASVSLRDPQPLFGYYFDLDEMNPGYVEQFAGVIARRNPVASRPPADFVRTYRNEHYEVWRNTASRRVLDHLPAQRRYSPTGAPACARIRELARGVGPGEALVAALRPPVAAVDLVGAPVRPPGWVPMLEAPGLVTTVTPGRLISSVRTPAGRFRVWQRGSNPRAMRIEVAGRPVGTASGTNSAGQYLPAGIVALPAGTHRVVLKRDGGRPLPGDGVEGVVGPVVFEPLDVPPRLVELPADRARELCDRPVDWIERVGPA